MKNLGWISANLILAFLDLKCFNKTVSIKLNIIFQYFTIKYSPIETKHIRANESPFMTEELHKAIMKRSKLRKKFLGLKPFSDRKAYTYKRLLRNANRTYFNNLDIKKATDNRRF